MAIAAPNRSRASASKTPVELATKRFSWTDAVLAVYRFLASVKLAVVSLGSLAFVLAFATFYEREHGAAAVNETIYQSVPFAVLLAFLGLNILCAALIRYPWKKRQIGFLITHTGLIVLLIGSAITLRLAEEGSFLMVEDKNKAVDVVMIKRDADVIRVEPFDPHDGPKEGLAFPFRHGAYAWEPGRTETLGDQDSPYQIVVRDFLPSAQLRYFHEADKNGVPMIKFDLEVTPPGMIRPVDPFQADTADRMAWFKAEGPFRRDERDSAGGVRLAFQAVEKNDEKRFLDDFLNPPREVATSVVRIRYRDKKGKDRVLDWPIAPVSKTQGPTLPDSDLTIVAASEKFLPNRNPSDPENEEGAESAVAVAVLSIRNGSGETREHWAVTAPRIATFVPPEQEGGEPLAPWVDLSYFHVPDFSGPVRGLVEVVGTADGDLYARAVRRSGIKPLGKLDLGKKVFAFGGPGTGAAMSLAFRVERYLPSGREHFSYIPREMPVGMKDQAVAAARVRLTIDGETRELWLLNSGQSKPDYRMVRFPRGLYRVAFDAERKPLGFKLKLVNFETFTEPGTEEPTKFESDVLLTDEDRRIFDQSHKIEMNYPLDHRGYKFYQSSFSKLEDANGKPTGQFASIFQVGHDPGRSVKYLGSILIVLGTFVQFYMRAGVATLFLKPKSTTTEPTSADVADNRVPPILAETPSATATAKSREKSTGTATDPDDL